MDPFFRTIPGLLDAIDDSEEVRSSFVIAAWKRAAGGQIAERTKPMGLQGRRLVIAVPELAWQRNLESLAAQLLFKINDSLGRSMVELIEFRVDPSVINRSEPGKISEDWTDRFEELPGEIADSAARIRDEQLRTAVLHAAANCLSRKHTYSYVASEKIN